MEGGDDGRIEKDIDGVMWLKGYLGSNKNLRDKAITPLWNLFFNQSKTV